MKGLSQARAHPAARRFASISFDGVDAATNHLALVCLHIQRTLHKAVRKHLPSWGQAGVDYLRVRMANRGVQAHSGTNTMTVQHALQTPETNSEAVIEPAKVGDVRQHCHALRWGEHRTCHRGVKVPFLDINHWPYSHTSIAREFERLTLKEGCVVSTGVSHKCSWLFHVQPFYGSIVCSQSLLHFSWKGVRTWDAGFWNMIDERGRDC